ncbi:hypothetical protein [uncultured Pseudodesulfovibrio sp.]|uniref:hypothetical protein n=1 Tax=uncultured Pseudodesulfovibrio sp. TaxID=2035858 RepID=UPI0029C9626F|nr:hypothetical protein [uncultured Pseudodesulfovibrio sp.]
MFLSIPFSPGLNPAKPRQTDSVFSQQQPIFGCIMNLFQTTYPGAIATDIPNKTQWFESQNQLKKHTIYLAKHFAKALRDQKQKPKERE